MRVALLLLPMLSLVVGCSPSGTGMPGGTGRGQPVRPTIPEAKDVTRVRVVPNSNLLPGHIPAIDYKEREKIEEVLGWLRRVDWSQKPGDITRMDLPPLSLMELFLNDGSTLQFSLTTHGIIYKDWLWGADIEGLNAMAKKLGAA